jgi:glutamyl-tRNA reductase
MISCTWQLIACGINHKSSSLKLREPLQLSREDMAHANATLCDLPGVRESVILATCNRVEFYLVIDRDHKPFDVVSTFYRELKNIDVSSLEPNFYTNKNREAAEHLFRVSSGIDSMVVGENQILGQIKEAYSSACAVKSAGKVMHRLFHQAFRVGKQVRSDTELGQGACSISTATIEMLKPKLDTIDSPLILMIGLNQMITLATSRLKRRGFDRFMFANRTRQAAVEFGSQHNAEGYGLDELPALLPRADVVITCTGSPQAIITDDHIGNMLVRNPGKQLIIADMAVPRDVEIKKDHAGIDYYDLDDVKKHAETNQSSREDAIPDAESLIERKLEQFMYWFDHVRHEPIYNGLTETFEQIRHDELKRVIENLPPESRDIIERATRRIVERIMQIKIRAAGSPEKEKAEK